jgi:hypothetical protein
MPAYERINAVVSLTLIGLALYFVLDFPRQVTTFTLFGTPLEVDSPRQWLMVVLLGGLAMAGTDSVVRVHPELSTRRLGYLATFWTLPGLLVILATQTLGLAPSPLAWAVGLVIVGLLLWLTINTEFQQVAPGLRQSPVDIGKTWLFATVIGLSMGQVTWALNYWRTGALNAGLLLFLIFYVMVGVAQQQLFGTLTRRTLWEFGTIALVALLVIFNL